MTRKPSGKRAELLAALAVVLTASMTGCHAVNEMIVKYDGKAKAGETHGGEVFQTIGNGFQIRRPTKSWRTIQRENVIIQRLDYSCGSGALATLLRHYFEDDITEQHVLEAIFQRIGRSEKPKEELKDRIQNGFSMLDLLNAAKDLGYLGAVVRIPFAKLAESPAPVIVRIEKYEYKHFVVFRGVHDDTVYLADPIRGNVRLSVQEFLEQWSGESLFLGKQGFGLPKEYPLALKVRGPARPELEVARQALFPSK